MVSDVFEIAGVAADRGAHGQLDRERAVAAVGVPRPLQGFGARLVYVDGADPCIACGECREENKVSNGWRLVVVVW